MTPPDAAVTALAAEPFFRTLPQPAYVCRLLRDDAGEPYDLIPLDANQAAHEGPALVPVDLCGTSLRAAFGGELLAPYLAIGARVLETGQPDSFDAVSEPDGRRYRATAHALGCDLLGLVALDITERHRAEMALAESELRYRTLLDDLNERAQIIGHDWRWRYVNRRVAASHGGLLRDAVGRSMFDVYPGCQETDLFRQLQRVMEERIPLDFEAPFTFPDGLTEWFDFRIQPVPEGIFILSIDITERHLAQEALATRTRELHRAVADLEEAREVAGIGVWRRDMVTGAAEWSPGMFLLFGGDPADFAPPLARVDAMLGPETVRLRDAAIAESARTGMPWELEAEVYPEDGDPRWMLWRGVSDVDAGGRLVAVRGTAMDITARKRSELTLRESSAELERRVAERTAALEAANEELRSFTYSVSHDLRAPVRSIAGFAGILERRYSDCLDEEGLHRLHNIVVAGETMGRVIDDLLAYSRLGQTAVQPRPMPLEPLLERVRIACEAALEETDGALLVEAPLAVPMGDSTLLEAVLLNLVQNALKYRRADAEPQVAIGATRHGDHVEVTVRDNGTGMPTDVLDRIFEPFFRLAPHADRPGSGIGLAIVRRSARMMGGDVTVRSELGTGSTFSVRLPAA